MAIGWAMISTGRHPDTRVAPAMGLAEDTALVAVYSRDKGRATEFARKHGAQAAYTSLEALLDDSRVEAVFIASPHHLHAPYTEMAARAGKHVLVEKPMAVSIDEAVNMVRTCQTHGVKLGVGFQLRHHPGCIEARRLVGEGVLGTVALAQAHMGGGTRGVVVRPPRTGLSAWWEHPEMIGGASAMMGTGVHAIDTLHFIVGQEVVEVAAITDGQSQAKPLENLATMCLRFHGGALGMVCCGSRMPDSRNDLTIYGSNGRIVLADSLVAPLQGTLEVVSDTVNTTVPYQRDPLALFTWQIEAFNRAIQQDEEPVASGLDGLRVVQVTGAMVEAASRKRTVTLDRLAV